MSLDLHRSIVIEIDGSGAVVGARKVKDALTDIDRATKGSNNGMTAMARSTDKATSSVNGLAMAAKAAIAYFSASALSGAIKETSLLAARYDTLGVVMGVVGNNAGYTRAEMDAFDAALRNTGISAIESRNSLAAMASANMDLSKSAKLARMAQDAAVIGGINSSEAFQRMTYGIKSAQVEVLRTIGINVDFEASYKKLAAQLGKNSQELTVAEKLQARTNVVMEAGAQIAGAYEASMDTAGKKLQSTTRYAEDAKVKLGAVFQPALILLVDTYTEALKDVNKQLERTDVVESWARVIKNEVLEIMQMVTGMNMALALAGKAAASVGMAVYGPGSALGVENSEKGFEHFAQAYLDYGKQYAEGEKKILALIGQQESLASGVAKQTTNYIDEQTRIAAGNAARAAATLGEAGAGGLSKSEQKAAESAAKEAQKAYDKMISDGKDAAAKLATYWSNYEDVRVAAIAEGFEKQAELEQANLELRTEFADKFRESVVGETAFKLSELKAQGEAYKQAGSDRVAVETWVAQETLKLSRDWSAGAVRGLRDYADTASDAASQVEVAITGGFRGAEDALVEFVKTGKLEFSDFADSVISDLARIAIQQSITGPLAKGAGDFLSGMFSGGTTGPKVGYAKGGIQSGAGISAFSSSIVSRPTVFPFASGVGLMGEAGPEAIMPLKRGPDGTLGVRGGGTNVQVNIANNTNAQASVKETKTQDGGVRLDVIIEDIVARSVTGRGKVGQAIQTAFRAQYKGA